MSESSNNNLSEPSNTPKRDRIAFRLSERAQATLQVLAEQIGVPANSVVNVAVLLMGAQFAPLLADHGLSLDILQEETRVLLEDARRVVETLPVDSRK